ncbi:MAG TPA: class I lanthipeptide [Chitinophaga sp.]|uniref:class I lanthipeptide n=1 Tax=Chitinophaga sp. TaxID=1869181 RepID=UPI002CB005CC|nr:class I lanthipeptide [Chitinophaga sp.]HVI49256.1 class I lanthipeptide [Chitinophaga sp.]
MKKKKIELTKKLLLSKSIIADLNELQQSYALGGGIILSDGTGGCTIDHGCQIFSNRPASQCGCIPPSKLCPVVTDGIQTHPCNGLVCQQPTVIGNL